MKVLVVTGGIGSGKSEVCRLMADMGLDLQYDADRRVKMLYDVHPGLLADIESALGCGLRDADGKFVPSLLAERIFTDRDALNKVENLVFPALMEDFETFCTDHPDRKIVVFESATILEKPQFDGFGDFVILVDAPFDLRLSRACSRDNKDKKAVMARMSNQTLMNSLSDGGSDPRIDAVIMNDDTKAELRIKTEKALSALLEDMNILKHQ